LLGLISDMGWYRHTRKEATARAYQRIKCLCLAYERMKQPSAMPQPLRSILFVCQGNIIRSPLAATYFIEWAKKNGLVINVNSVGMETHPGKPAHALAKQFAHQHGLSLQCHSTTPLSRDLIKESDLVLVMEVAQKDLLSKLYTQDRDKVFILVQFCGNGSIEITDPYCGTQEDFKSCIGRIREACDYLIRMIGELNCPGKLVQGECDTGPQLTRPVMGQASRR
jgi:protein-tyrosine-phosphatase